MRNKKLKELIILLLIFIAFMFIFYGVSFLFNNTNNKYSDIINEINKNNTKKKPEVKEIEKEKEVSVEPYVNNLPNYRNNYGNGNIMGMVEIPGIINEALIVRGGDNDYYLNNNLWNQYDGIGAPFFDYRNLDLDHDKQINIYGHNSQNINILDRLPLSKLINYLDINFFNTYKDVYLYTDTQKIHYEVIAAKIIQKDNNYHMTLHFYDDKDYVSHTNNLLNDSNNRRNVNITKEDKTLIFQTCNYNPPNTLVLVICKSV